MIHINQSLEESIPNRLDNPLLLCGARYGMKSVLVRRKRGAITRELMTKHCCLSCGELATMRKPIIRLPTTQCLAITANQAELFARIRTTPNASSMSVD